MPKYYLTTPIYYVNGKPHIGHVYTTVIADALARFHRLQREETRFITGTDENSQTNVQAMQKLGETDVMSYLDRTSAIWKETWKDLDITCDDFIRTTEERHLAGVRRFWDAVQKSGDIYEGIYDGWYCTGCEGFKTETDLVNGQCADHVTKEIQHVKEKNYFFRLSKYREQLLALYTDDSACVVMPQTRRNEVRKYVEDHLADISISRESKVVSVGIPVPGDDSQRIYVWFDALLNYMTAVGYGTDDALFQKYWPADLHLMAKEIIKFHCALWPAMIMSAAQNDPLLQGANGQALLPKAIFAHGHFTIDGQKISKSLGNVIDPRELIPHYGFDTIRYFLLREIPCGEDGDFSRERLKERYHADLGNTFGNLVNRAIAMSKKYFDGCVPSVDVHACMDAEGGEGWMGAKGLEMLRTSVERSYGIVRCDTALEAVWNGVGELRRSGLLQANKYIEETQPFKLVKTDPEAVARILYALLEACRWYAWLVYPVMPTISREIFTQLGMKADEELAQGWNEALVWGGLQPGAPLGEPKPLFPRQEG